MDSGENDDQNRVDMSIFNFLNSKKPRPDFSEAEISEILDRAFPAEDREDYLGKAAEAGHAARASITAKEYDKAWRLLHEQKILYMKHANRCDWKAEDALNLDGSVSQHFANILRLEGKNDQALVHILYWIITARNPIKGHDQKLKAYFGRCKFEDVALYDAEQFIKENKSQPDFMAIQAKVSEWRNGKTITDS